MFLKENDEYNNRLGADIPEQIHPEGQSSQAEMICPSWQMHGII